MWWTNRPAGSVPRPQPHSGPEAPAAHPVLQPLAATPQPNSTGQAVPLVVYVHGAVGDSGVYRLPAGSRVIDAIEEAGGMAPRARPGDLNLAAPVSDGQAVFVPRRGQQRSQTNTIEPLVPDGSGSIAPAGPISLATATQAELETLPGVGPVLAERILSYRDTRGQTSVADLENVPGIGPKTLAELAARLIP